MFVLQSGFEDGLFPGFLIFSFSFFVSWLKLFARFGRASQMVLADPQLNFQRISYLSKRRKHAQIC